MKRLLSWTIAGLAMTCVAGAARAQDRTSANTVLALANRVAPTSAALSQDCRSTWVAGDKYSRPLRGIRRAVRAGREPHVLAIGSSSTVGTGASAPANSYVAKLENDLDSAFTGVSFDVEARGVGGEMAEGQSARMQRAVLETKPDLVLWQVGTNDAINHVDINRFKTCLRRTLAWLAANNFDVMLVDPQYGEALAQDARYVEVVAAIAEIAAEQHVLLVDRFEAMRQLSAAHGDAFYLASDKLHLNDTGHRCMAEQLARAIVAGVLLADKDAITVGATLAQPRP